MEDKYISGYNDGKNHFNFIDSFAQNKLRNLNKKLEKIEANINNSLANTEEKLSILEDINNSINDIKNDLKDIESNYYTKEEINKLLENLKR